MTLFDVTVSHVFAYVINWNTFSLCDLCHPIFMVDTK